MLATWMICLALLAPQDAVAAVAVRGDAELSPAAALASAQSRVDEHVQAIWRERAERAVAAQRPFWLPEFCTDQVVRRWLADLEAGKLVQVVDRRDHERQHEFGNSWQTTLWVAENSTHQQRAEQRLRTALRRAERDTALKYGGVAVGWTLLIFTLGWIDRLSRGYMTGRLRLAGLLLGLAVPAAAFLV